MDREHYISYLREEANHEIARLGLILRDSRISDEERDVARLMLDFYQEARLEEILPQSQEPDCLLPPRKECPFKNCWRYKSRINTTDDTPPRSFTPTQA